MRTIYERLGVKPVINGVGTVTRLGGSLMPPPVVQAMLEASRQYVSLPELQAAAGRRLAELTRNEAAYVSSGAAAGLVLAAAACITGNDPEKMALLPHPERIPNGRHKAIIHRCQRIGYDFAIRQTGVDLIEIGPTRAEAAQGSSTTPAELERVLDDATAAVFYIAGASHATGALPLAHVVEIAHARDVPVVVDAAAQIPPVENLWRFSGKGGPAPWAQALAALGIADAAFPDGSVSPPARAAPEGGLWVDSAGADLSLFSGGKGFCGPQATGLILGRADLIDAIAKQGNPNPFIGRPMKVAKEEICGLVAAIEWYLNVNYVALAARYEEQVRHVMDALGEVPGVVVSRDWPNEAGQPMPRARVRLTEGAALSRDELQERLLAEDPAIELSNAGPDSVLVNPQDLRDGDEILIADALGRLLTPAAGAESTRTADHG